MDRRERIESLDETLIAALAGWQTDIWTAIPGIVQNFNAVEMTCEVQPTIRFKIKDPALRTYKSDSLLQDPSGQFAWDKMPLLLDCPVVFPGGGGLTLTFPIKAGDECLVIFASRCIDAWWQQGGIQNQAAVRMHDLSDGFVLPQVRSQPRRFTVSNTAAQLRNDAGSMYIEIDATTGNVHIKSPMTTIEGDAHVTGTLSGNVVRTDAGINLGSHTHSGVTPGGSNTGGPV